MKLIDADKLKEELKINGLGYQYYMLNNAPTVEAIPISWIKKWAKKNGLDCYDYDYPTEKNDWWYAIEKMLKDWEKENDSK